MPSPRKKSPSSKRRSRGDESLTKSNRSRAGGSLRLLTSSPTALRREFRLWRAALPTPLERDTLLVPEWIAESVVQEAERFLDTRLRDDFAERLAAKAHYLYPRHAHFKKMLNRPGNRGRDNLYVYMRHWTAGWLKRERPALFKRLPWSYAQGRRLPFTPGQVVVGRGVLTPPSATRTH